MIKPMTRPPVTQKPAAPGNYGIGRANPITRITFHHIVGDAPAAIARFQTPGVLVSSTYVIGSDGTIYQCVDEKNCPYTDANYDSNNRTISIEHAGPPYASQMYNASAKLVAYLIDKYKITDFKRHRDVSNTPTACPGTLNVEKIISDANKLREEETMANLSPHFIGRIIKGLWGRAATQTEIDTYSKVEEATMLKRIIDDPQTDAEYARVDSLAADAETLPSGKYLVQ